MLSDNNPRTGIVCIILEMIWLDLPCISKTRDKCLLVSTLHRLSLLLPRLRLRAAAAPRDLFLYSGSHSLSLLHFDCSYFLPRFVFERSGFLGVYKFFVNKFFFEYDPAKFMMTSFVSKSRQHKSYRE